MKTKPLFAVLAVLLLLGSPGLAGVKVTRIDEGKKALTSTEKSSGKFLWKNTVNYSKIKDASGQAFVYVEEKGAGTYGKDHKELTWRTQAWIKNENNVLTPDQLVQTFFDQSGKKVSSLQKDYDAKSSQVICSMGDQTKTFKFYPDTLDKEMLAIVLADFPLDQAQAEYHLITHEPAIYKITMKNLGTENLQVGNASVACYKLQMIPDLGALNILGAFVPKTYFWYTTAVPHEFVRYEGLESGLGTPYIVMQAGK